MNIIKKGDIRIKELDINAEIPYDLLLLADPEKAAIGKYIFHSQIFIAEYQNAVIGVFVLQEVDKNTIELKNIAVKEELQKKGIGRYLLGNACEKAREDGYTRVILGTGNASIGELYFYQKMGFEIYDIRKNFILDNYTEAIIENGIRNKHMLMLEKIV